MSNHQILHELHNLRDVVLKISNRLEDIMSAISDYAAKVTAYFDRMDKAHDDIQTELKALADQIAALQASPGVLTPEDQAALDAIQARASKAADAADALDTLPKPAAPPA